MNHKSQTTNGREYKKKKIRYPIINKRKQDMLKVIENI